MKKYSVFSFSLFAVALTLSTAMLFTGCAGKTGEDEEEDTLTEVPSGAADTLDDASTSTFGEELSDEEVEEVLLDDDDEKK